MPRQEYERKSVLSGGKKVKIVKNFSLTRRERIMGDIGYIVGYALIFVFLVGVIIGYVVGRREREDE